MLKKALLIGAALSLWTWPALRADEIRAAPAGGIPMLGERPLNAFAEQKEDTLQAKLEPEASSPTGWAWKLVCRGPYDNEYVAQLIAPTRQPVKKGDVLLARVTMRGTSHTETEAAEAVVVFQRASDPWNKSLAFHLSLTPEWKTYSLPFVCDANYAAGAASFVFQVGFPKQELEIGEVEVLNYGSKVALSTLPQTQVSYGGREADAAWRKEAEERIEKIRKAPLTIQVVDSEGKPVPDAKVEVTETQPAFHFGTAVTAAHLTGTSENDEKYRANFLALFDIAVFENDLKWGGWDSKERPRTFQALDWLEAHQIPVRGHNLVWPSWTFSPKSLRKSAGNAAELRERIEQHIRDEVTALKGRLCQWDVVNEPFTNHDITDILGRKSLVDWFVLTHELDPKPVLFLNDYAGFMNGGRDSRHKDNFEDTLKYLKAQGAPIGGLGLQAHFGSFLTPIDKILEELDRWAALDLQMAVTEFDIDTKDEALQADYTRDLLTAVFSHPSTTDFLVWGFWEGSHWRPDAAFFREDWSEKPVAKVWRELVREKWRTNAQGQTDAQGSYGTRAFLGGYRVTASKDGITTTGTTELGKEGQTLTLRLAEIRR